MGLGWGEFSGVTGDNTPHSHHAVQVMLSEHPQPLWTPELGERQLCGAIIGPEQEHCLGSNGKPVRLIYVEPHSDAGRRLLGLLDQGLRLLTTNECEALQGALEACPSPDRALIEALSPLTKLDWDRAQDDEIESWIKSLPTPLPEQLSAAACARQVGLSSSRFLHRFRAHTGLPLRPYLRWRRLLVALGEVLRGMNLTEAAHAAGFSDAAHFTRTFRRHFGLTPSALAAFASPA